MGVLHSQILALSKENSFWPQREIFIVFWDEKSDDLERVSNLLLSLETAAKDAIKWWGEKAE